MTSPGSIALWENGSPTHMVNQELRGFLASLEPSWLLRLFMLKQVTTIKGRTYFLEIIAKVEEIRYSVL